jgi:hypothetical protein
MNAIKHPTVPPSTPNLHYPRYTPVQFPAMRP